MLRDIPERKRANAELETLVYSASHDLKSPMVSLLSYFEYLRLDYGEALGPEGNHYLNRMADSTQYMQQLIHDPIDLSRVGRSGVDPIEVDLSRLVGAIAEDAAAANPAAELRVGRLPVVTGDPVGFRQLCTNLLENAVRHGGRPDLVVVVDGQAGPAGTVELSVRDHGKGIPDEHRERVFGVFERAAGGGAGLLGEPGGPRGGAAGRGDLVRVQADRRPPLPLRDPAAGRPLGPGHGLTAGAGRRLRPRTRPTRPRPGAAPGPGAGCGPARSAGRSRSRPAAHRRRRPPA